MARIALFVDGASMFYAQRAQGWHIDFRSVYEHFTAGKQVTGAYYFTATPPARNLDAVQRYRRFRTALIYIGWNVIDKEVHVITDRETGQTKTKGNLDIELTFRMLSSADAWDEAILFGVDVDYIPIIKHLQNLGKTITCVGRREMTSIELINAARFIDLESLRGLIEKRK